MTKDDIIRMAREAGFVTGTVGPLNLPFVRQVQGSFAIELERFAKLVAADEREACVSIIKDHQNRWAVPVNTEDFNEIFDACATDIRTRSQS